MTRTAWFDSRRPRVLAHRGFALGDPENSIAAFQAALDAGATHLETDTRATADGVAVLVHDPRLPDGRRIDRLTLDELRRSRPAVCTVAEALLALPRARFNIDVKALDAARPLAEAVRDADAIGRVLVASFSGRRRRAAVRALPGVATSASGLAVLLAVLGERIGAAALIRRALAGVDAVQIPVRVLGIPTTGARFIDSARAAGCEVHYWVIDEPARMRRLVASGASGIVTDRTDLAVAALRDAV